MFLFLLDALVRGLVNTCGFTVLRPYDDNVICPARRQKHEPVHRVLKLAACTQDTLEQKKSQHTDFQTGPPRLYYPCSTRLNFAVRMGSGA